MKNGDHDAVESPQEVSSCGVSPLSVPLSLFADGTGFVKGSSVVINEKENSAFSSLDVAGEKENSAFSPDLTPIS